MRKREERYARYLNLSFRAFEIARGKGARENKKVSQLVVLLFVEYDSVPVRLYVCGLILRLLQAN